MESELQINELAKAPEKTRTLFQDLKDATPFEVRVPKHLRRNAPDVFNRNHEIVSNVLFLGDFGGISVELKPSAKVTDPRIVSITMFEMPHRHPLRKRVKEYCKHRIKILRRQSEYYPGG